MSPVSIGTVHPLAPVGGGRHAAAVGHGVVGAVEDQPRQRLAMVGQGLPDAAVDAHAPGARRLGHRRAAGVCLGSAGGELPCVEEVERHEASLDVTLQLVTVPAPAADETAQITAIAARATVAIRI
jgi:hypothetical protein